MKKLIVSFAFSISVLSVFGQGIVNFANIGDADFPVYFTDGVTRLGPSYSAQLYYASGVVVESSALTPLAGSTAPFLQMSGNNTGYFMGGEKVLPFGGGTTVTLQVRVWEASRPSWETASVTPGAFVGQSGLISLALGTSPNPPPGMVGLSSFNLYEVVPEPSAVVLGVLAAGSLLFIRRRK